MTTVAELLSPWSAPPFLDHARGLHADIVAEVEPRVGASDANRIAEGYVSGFLATSARYAVPAMLPMLTAHGPAGENADQHARAEVTEHVARGDVTEWCPELAGHLDRAGRAAAHYTGAARAFAAALSRLRLGGPFSTCAQPALEAVSLGGDMHPRGAVVLLDFGERRLVYKPRSLAVDLELNRVLDDVRAKAPSSAPAALASLNWGAEGWQDFVEHDPSSDAAARESYLRKLGGLIAIALELRMTDLHYENVVCGKGSPYVVDAECLFHVPLSTAADGADPLYGNHLETVLASGLLPNFQARSRLLGPADSSPLGVRDERRPTMLVPHLAFGTDGSIDLTDTIAAVPGSLVHAPEGAPLLEPGSEGAHQLIDGFCSVAAVMQAGVVQASMDRIRGAAQPMRVRQLVRATWRYTTALRTGRVPSPSSRPGPDRNGGAVVNTADALTPWVARIEEETLARGVIPLFERDLSSGELVADGGATCPGKLPAPLAVIRGGLGRVRSNEARHVDAIEQSLALATGRPHRRADPVIDFADPLAGGRAILDWIRGHRLGAPFGASWLTSRRLDADSWALITTGVGVYDGTAGMLLAVASWEAASGQDTGMLSELFDTTRRHVASIVGSDCGRTMPAGAYSGTIGALWVLSQVVKRGRASTDVRELTEHFADAVRLPPGWDLTAGTAGVAMLADDLDGVSAGCGALAALSEAATERLVADLTAHVGRSPVLTGAAHGLSGAAAALARRYGRTGDHRLATAAAGAWALEDAAVRSRVPPRAGSDEPGDTTVSGGWCWGTSGRIQSRAEALTLLRRTARTPSRLEEYLRTWTDLTDTADGAVSGRSLCHGDVGRWLARRSRSQQAVHGRADGPLPRPLRLSDAFEGPARTPDVGLMTGLSGTLFALAVVLDPSRCLPIPGLFD